MMITGNCPMCRTPFIADTFNAAKPKTDAELDFEWRQSREKDVFESSEYLIGSGRYIYVAPNPKVVERLTNTLYPNDVVAIMETRTGIKGWTATVDRCVVMVGIPPRQNRFSGLVVK